MAVKRRKFPNTAQGKSAREAATKLKRGEVRQKYRRTRGVRGTVSEYNSDDGVLLKQFNEKYTYSKTDQRALRACKKIDTNRLVGPNHSVVWTGFDIFGKDATAMGRSMKKGAQFTALKIAKQMESYAKKVAPWQDRTGLARASLRSGVTYNESTETYTIFLDHGVDYGLFLEYGTSHARPYPIIRPTVEMFNSTIMRELERNI